MDTGTENGAELRLEDFRISQAEANGPATQKRIFLLTNIETFGRLVPANIQCANDRALRSNCFCNLAGDLILLFLIRWGRPSEVEKFRAVEADPISATTSNVSPLRTASIVMQPFLVEFGPHKIYP